MGKKIIIFLLIGFLLRLYLSSQAASVLIWDMEAFDHLAKEVLAGHWAIDCCLRNTGYSLFLSVVYFIFGTDNIVALRVIQIILDMGVALIIFKIAREMFGEKIGLASFILYIINPFTSTFTGWRLSESLTLFLVSLVMLIVSRGNFTKRKLLWFLFGLVLGLLLFVRYQFYYFSFIFIFLLSALYFRKFNKIIFPAVVMIGFLLASSYTLVGNWANFKIISLVHPYDMAAGRLYLIFYTQRYPELGFTTKVDPEYGRVLAEYDSTDDKIGFTNKYLSLFFSRLSRDYPLFIKNYLMNIYFLWDKEYMYVYRDPFYPADKYPLKIYNLAVLILFAVGFVGFIKVKRKKALRSTMVIFTGLFFLYATFVFTLVSSESRHSLPFYPLIFLWAGYGIVRLKNILYKK
jgi:4-amino-4-deoxy-L-arabinose transferase-like glycosyltransferase